MSTVLFLDGRSGLYRVHRDPHTGEPYVYARNDNGIYARVYVEPGESVSYIERGSVDNPYCSALEFTRPVAA